VGHHAPVTHAWHTPVHHVHPTGAATSHGFAHGHATQVASNVPTGAGHCLTTSNAPSLIAPPVPPPLTGAAGPVTSAFASKPVVAGAALGLVGLGGLGGAGFAALTPPPGGSTTGISTNPPTGFITPPPGGTLTGSTPPPTNVPEPASIALFAAAVLVLAMLGWMRSARTRVSRLAAG
jgi:hypothetical protein